MTTSKMNVVCGPNHDGSHGWSFREGQPAKTTRNRAIPSSAESSEGRGRRFRRTLRMASFMVFSRDGCPLAKTRSEWPIALPVPQHLYFTRSHTLAVSPAQASPAQAALRADANEYDECSVWPEPRWVAPMEFSGRTTHGHVHNDEEGSDRPNR